MSSAAASPLLLRRSASTVSPTDAPRAAPRATPLNRSLFEKAFDAQVFGVPEGPSAHGPSHQRDRARHALRDTHTHMKKLDFHIHTMPTVWDAHFDFDFDTLKRYVTEAALDGIAITNHNVFDRAQFDKIRNALDIPVFAGVEVTLDCGHLLVIAGPENIEAFDSEVSTLGTHVSEESDSISLDGFLSLFKGIDDYLVIPHYGKGPAVSPEALERLGNRVCCGEVTSPKKFVAAQKNGELSPVLFSDCRISASLHPLPVRQTFVDCGEITLPALKVCLRDKAKVALSATRGLFQVLENGQLLSTGLNVVLGGRSSGKSHLLDDIADSHEGVHYIRQFQLLERDETQSAREFTDNLGREEGRVAEDFLASFKEVVHDVMDIDLVANEKAVGEYIGTLCEFASESHRQDIFSKTPLFNASEFSIGDSSQLRKLIEAVRQLIDSSTYRQLIDEHVDIAALKRLAIALITRYRDEELARAKREFVNTLVREVKRQLQTVTGAPVIEDVDLYNIMLEREKVTRFRDLVKHVCSPAAIHEDEFQKYRVVARKGPFESVAEVKKRSGTKASFQAAFLKYDEPYEYLQALKQISEVSKADICKLFAKVSYEILNQHGLKVSGGERSEFNLLQRIKDAQKFDLLLIDEPESSFDNLFLRTGVNKLIKDIAETMPVVVVTHNSTVGASIEPNYLVFTQKRVVKGVPEFKVYSGYATDPTLKTVDGETIATRDLLLDSLEAGEDAYIRRKERYEALKDRR